MIFFSSILAADSLSVSVTPVSAKEIDNIKFKNGMYDTINLSSDTEKELTTVLPTKWDLDTLMFSTFDNNASAGSENWVIENIRTMLVKRKSEGSNEWITIASKDINSPEDLNVYGTDITAVSGKYQYAFVPIQIDNGAEGEYLIAQDRETQEESVECKYNTLVIADSDELWTTILTDGYCDTTNVVPNAILEPLYSKYPTIVSNSSTNYQNINVNAQFYKLFDENGNCDVELMNDIESNTRLREKVIAFLTNRKPKILKNIDGRSWLCFVTTPPTNSADGIYWVRNISFTCTEIGDLNSEEDLFDNGLLKVSEEWIGG